MSRPPAFQFYPADFLVDENVVLMSLAEVGAYIKLMCFCWREGSIPNDTTILARLVGCDSSAMNSHWVNLSKCFEERDGRLIHSRLERELEKQIDYHNERHESGKKGAKARWGKKLGKNSSAIGQLSADLIAKNGSSSSSSSSDITPIAPKGAFPSCFELAWEQYPKLRRTGKQAAFKAYTRAGKRLVDRGMSKDQAVGFMQAKIIEYANSPLGHSDFVVAPAVWFNQGRYDDDPTAWNHVGGNGNSEPESTGLAGGNGGTAGLIGTGGSGQLSCQYSVITGVS